MAIPPTARILGVSSKGMWRLRLGLLEIVRQGYGSARQLQTLLGHFAPHTLLRRELLAVFGVTYRFITEYGTDGHMRRLSWPSVRRELTWAAHLIPLAQRSLTVGWLPDVYCFDASWWGIGIVEMKAAPDTIRDTARDNER